MSIIQVFKILCAFMKSKQTYIKNIKKKKIWSIFQILIYFGLLKYYLTRSFIVYTFRRNAIVCGDSRGGRYLFINPPPRPVVNFFSNDHILVKFSSNNLFDHSKCIRKYRRIQKSYQLISLTKYYSRFWWVKINDFFFDFFFWFFFAVFTNQSLTILCLQWDIYFL